MARIDINETYALNDYTNEEQEAGNMMLAGKPAVGWKNATLEWGSLWQGYTYGAITINAALVIWTTANLCYISIRGRKLISRKYFLTLNIMVLIFALTRILFYAIDPKSINGLMPKLAGNLLLNTSFPTLTVGFCMLYVALRQCSIPNRNLLPLILKTKCIALFVIVCFAVSFLTDILVTHFASLALMMIVCQMFYVVWGILFCCIYLALVIKYRAAVRKTRTKLKKSCYRKGHCRRGFDKNNLKEIPGCMKITCVTATLFLLLAILNIYIILVEVGMLKKSASLTIMCAKYRQAWPFFIFHLTFAVVEHLMAITLALAGTQPLRWLRIPSVTIYNQREELTITSLDDTIAMSDIFTTERTVEPSLWTTSMSASQHTIETTSTSAQISTISVNIPEKCTADLNPS